MQATVAFEIQCQDRREEETAFFRLLGLSTEYISREYSQLQGRAEEITHILSYGDRGLALRQNRARPAGPTCVDFEDPALQYRLRTSGRKQGLGRAVGLKSLKSPTVLDATAGLGRDAYILAALGCRVTMLERSPIVHALLEDGLKRGLEFPDMAMAQTLGRMSLHRIDAYQWLKDIESGQQQVPDVIYLDPMFPERKKSASVKKDMASLQCLLGPDMDLPGLLQLARECARLRVVVKRPGAKHSFGLPPCSFQVSGKTSHFDVYLSAT